MNMKSIKIGSMIFVHVFMFSCDKENMCIDEKNKYQGNCFLNYDPVCGCNSVTYGNACEAKSEGVKSWVKGECK